jgi:serpin B
MKRVLRACLRVALLLATGCDDGAVELQEPELLKSDLPREADPAVDPTDLDALVAGNTDFAVKLYHAVREDCENLVFSPYSVSTTYAMVYAGARGGTATEMASTLCFRLPPELLHAAFNRLDLDLASRCASPEDPDSDLPRLNVVNSLWGQTGLGFEDTFLDCLSVNYGAGLWTLDFWGAPESARATINDWVVHETEGRIGELIPAGAVTPLTDLVLVNALFFGAGWADAFERENTAPAQFHLLDGTEVSVPTMRQTSAHCESADGDGYRAVELAYMGAQFSMVLIVPDAGSFDTVESSLSGDMLRGVFDALYARTFVLEMPRFETGGGLDLKKTMSDLGMAAAFGPSADFSGMLASPAVSLGASGHEATITVNEEGTEAAAGTFVGATHGYAYDLTIDRPFIFLIRDRPTGTILFLGRVLDPRG